jgi:hypothetical protein
MFTGSSQMRTISLIAFRLVSGVARPRSIVIHEAGIAAA